MSHYSDPTANSAMGAVDREIRRAQKSARRMARRYVAGTLSNASFTRERRSFSGLFRSVWDSAFRQEVKTLTVSNPYTPSGV